LSIFISIALGVSLTELPRTSILRSFVFLLICLCCLMATAFQNYFTTFLLNPGYEKQISNIRDILQSGIQFGYRSDIEGILKNIANEYEYSMMPDRRIVCDNQCQCLELMLKDVNFAWFLMHIELKLHCGLGGRATQYVTCVCYRMKLTEYEVQCT
jgi:hypothetical protein